MQFFLNSRAHSSVTFQYLLDSLSYLSKHLLDNLSFLSEHLLDSLSLLCLHVHEWPAEGRRLLRLAGARDAWYVTPALGLIFHSQHVLGALDVLLCKQASHDIT